MCRISVDYDDDKREALMSKLRESGVPEQRLEDIFGNAAAAAFGIADERTILPSDPLSLYEKTAAGYSWNPYR